MRKEAAALRTPVPARPPASLFPPAFEIFNNKWKVSFFDSTRICLQVFCFKSQSWQSSVPPWIVYMQHEGHRVPVTALAFWDRQVVLVGEGNYLKAYDHGHREALATIRVFQSQVIHGIKIIDHGTFSMILAWGGRSLAHVRSRSGQDGLVDLTLHELHETSDWLLDVAWDYTHDVEAKAVLVTAHDALLLYDPFELGPKGPLQQIIPGSNCILYSAHVTWLSGSKCLIASGTAFGDVIIWSCCLSPRGQHLQAEQTVHFTFPAHEGSVFGVQIASASAAAAIGGRQHVLASCSDDRTIRLWDISDLKSKSPTLTEFQRQTGFGPRTAKDAKAPPLLAKTMGHQSRIWQVRLLMIEASLKGGHSPDSLETIRLLSFGEDASCITWRLHRDTEPTDHATYKLEQLFVQKRHAGKNIWAVARNDTLTVATGGADGSLALTEVSCEGDVGTTIRPGLSLLHDPNHVQKFKAYDFVSDHELVATNEQGTVWKLVLNQAGIDSRIELAPEVSGLRGYSVIASEAGVVFLGGIDGKIYSIDAKSHHPIQIAETSGKVGGLFAQRTKSSEDDVLVALLVTNVGKDAAYLLLQHLESPHWKRRSLRLPRGFIATSFAFGLRGSDIMVLVGSRSGALAVFVHADVADTGDILPMQLFSGVHGSEAVTSLQLLLLRGYKADDVHIVSTGRDGTYAVHKFETCDGTPMLQTLHQSSLPFGSNIEGSGISPNNHLWTWGFRSKQFIVFDVRTQQEVMTVECGGAHRNWVFRMNAHGGTLVWTKASQVNCKTQTHLPMRTINAGGHGREIKSTAISSQSSAIIATGAEDTDIKLSVCENGTFRCLHTLHKHNTGVQSLSWSAGGNYLFSSGGFEEFYIWKITANVPYLDIGVVCESTHPRSGKSDLRIMNFAAQDLGPAGESRFSITMVYSDSTIRAWQYDHGQWSLLAQGEYLTSCLTQCLLLGEGRSEQLLTASTDGHLAAWNIDRDHQTAHWTARHQLHQDAILCMIPHHLSDGSELVMTGGDDNAIGITRVTKSLSSSPSTLQSVFLPRAHAAAVTGLAVVGASASQVWIVSVSIDQRVKLWRIDVHLALPGPESLDVMCVANVFTAVADASCVEAIRLPDRNHGRDIGVLVCGVGMDLWRVNGDVMLLEQRD